MPQKKKSKNAPSDNRVDTLCNDCGKTFSKFLHDMEEQNAKVVCPSCGKAQDQRPAPLSKRGGSFKKQ